MGEQALILLPNLARLGIGFGEGGGLDNPEAIIAIAAFHLVSSAVLAAGAFTSTGLTQRNWVSFLVTTSSFWGWVQPPSLSGRSTMASLTLLFRR